MTSSALHSKKLFGRSCQLHTWGSLPDPPLSWRGSDDNGGGTVQKSEKKQSDDKKKEHRKHTTWKGRKELEQATKETNPSAKSVGLI